MPFRMTGAARALITVAVCTAAAVAAQAAPPDKTSIERGRYLVKITGCNDCHTPGYAENAGKVAERDWLVGVPLGWKGPWGTTYASNLRLVLQGQTEDQWVKSAAGKQYRPPMPWFALRDMKERDLRDMYRFIRSLGPAGQPMPAYLPPGQEPQGPVVTFPAPPK